MSLKGTVEICVHLNQFRNVDLFHQGVYQLRVSVLQRCTPAVAAQPYMILEDSGKKSMDSMVQASRLQDTEFYSKAFIIKYCEEQIELNDTVIFRASVEYNESCQFSLKIELLFTELPTLTQEDYKPEKLKLYMKPVSAFEAKISNAHRGIKEFVPVTFDEMHFAYLRLVIHSLLLDFKYRYQPDSPEQFDTYIRKVTNNFAKDALFSFYRLYAKSLRNSHERFFKYYKQVIAECVRDPKIRTKFGNVSIPPHIPPYAKSLDPNEESKDHKNQTEINIVNFFDLHTQQPDICTNLILEFNQLSCNLFQIWYMFMESYEHFFRDLTKKLEAEYLEKIKERWGESIFQNFLEVDDLAESTEQKHSQIGRKHKEVAKQIRSNQYYQELDTLNVEDVNLFPKANIHPILFKELYYNTKPKSIKGLHLVILVHGYQGNSFDMRLWKNYLSVKYPEHLIMTMTSNEDNTDQDIFVMGKNFADEVKKWIKEWCPRENFTKLSFLGFSLGGLIVRAALPHLEKYKDKMYSIMTLATPHLGYMISANKLVDTGMWVIKKWKKCISLNQLTLADARNPEDQCIYKLSKLEGLNWFKNIVLVSSYQDSYVPFESARIQRSTKISSESSKGKVYNQMINNIMGRISKDKMQRIDVNYEIKGKKLDNMIGRAAHIAILENQSLIRLFIYSFDDIFD